jgi:two-component system nitrogen regulation sensor histidine kinase NtrY
MSETQDLNLLLEKEERKRRKREGWAIISTGLMILVFAYLEVKLPPISSTSSLTSNVLFFLLINVNIVLLILLVFLVVRNAVKLIFERKRKLLGAKLKTRLMLAFVALSLFPAMVLFGVSVSFITNSIETWFDIQVEHSLRGSLEVAQTYYQNSANNALFYARQLSRRITELGLFEPDRREELKALLQEKQHEYNLGTVEVFSHARNLLVFSVNEKVPTGVSLQLDPEVLTDTLRGKEVTHTQPFGDGDIISGSVPLRGPMGRIVGGVVVDYYLPKSVVKRTNQISRSYHEYKQLQILKLPIKNSYILTLLLITLIVIFSAMWFGFYLARGITVPIQKLAEGTHEVAQGNWDYRIEIPEDDDEIGTLVKSFNLMTADLKKINTELVQRRQHMEIILANVAAGVVSIDQWGRITTVNKAAERMFGLNQEKVLGKRYREVLGPDHQGVIAELFGNVREHGKGPVEREVKITLPDRILTVMVTSTPLKDDEGKLLGLVVVLDDITQILKMQRMEAWREVARRIAHEIKNPLTPIQLSAQRLRKRYAGLLKENGAVLDKCTRTIISQVEELKSLVNEFSSFARLPASKPTPNNLNEIVREALFLYTEGHKEIDFQVHTQEDLPVLELDQDQIRRVIMNLLDNAVAAVGKDGSIEICTHHNTDLGIVTMEVADNGHGISTDVRSRLFEPYFSTKKDGTGLGLAIVSTIVADHRGYIRVRNNEPRGTRFIIEFPVKQHDASISLRVPQAEGA